MKKRTSSLSDLDNTVCNLPISDVLPILDAEDDPASDVSSHSDLSVNISDSDDDEDEDDQVSVSRMIAGLILIR
ncbi:hypothetical protein Ciccas_003995 [Cichlidogyrus casuarinus]|uniref:Uncharacterized protein n=1 Tax=Cichlidogyrus casuarinus TaxID=1844966 RepID=A0ABD2QG57_9PLAT